MIERPKSGRNQFYRIIELTIWTDVSLLQFPGKGDALILKVSKFRVKTEWNSRVRTARVSSKLTLKKIQVGLRQPSVYELEEIY